MQRSVDPSDVIALPMLTMRGVHAMAEGLVAAGGGGVPGGAEHWRRLQSDPLGGGGVIHFAVVEGARWSGVTAGP